MFLSGALPGTNLDKQKGGEEVRTTEVILQDIKRLRLLRDLTEKRAERYANKLAELLVEYKRKEKKDDEISNNIL